MIAVIASAIAGGVWRRILGGWLGMRRSYVVASGSLLTWPLWFVLPPLPALLASVACVAFWTPGHEMTNDKAMWLRYGPFAVGWIVARHLKITPWTEVGEIVAGSLFWGSLAALCWGLR
ncbi:hypothetical protein UFOVP1672_32 [uncultured Caudovirales phage]|uniref:Uncharacterized protein n=1 Tax=uncultured Caudovirales phage TaxID=2100421 RepID=A0A6J5SBH5_9CAUD|nr:hypothetical protein UFOVP988_54 [uncultured Caudovirales phage]CAB4210936.1 hypothetical protein UFOVP1425_54 [uncultured Caudovirales phage]CAB4223374.1 hypothetical protein UFOVP1672_32 [uncultured Caudovirales phage]